MDPTILSLLFQIEADPSKGNEAVERFAKQTNQSLGYVQAQIQDYNKSMNDAYAEAVSRSRTAGEQMDSSLLSNSQSVRLLSAEMGVHLPRAVSGAVAQMLPGINSLGPALLGVFAIAEIPKFIRGVQDASAALGGYTEAVRNAEKADIEASNAALIHFATIAQGTILIAETNRALANLAAKQGDWKEEVKAADQAMVGTKATLLDLLGPIGSAINLFRAYKAAVQETSATEGEAANLRERLMQQLDQMEKLQADQQKEAARAAKQAADRAKREAKEAETEADREAREKYEANQRAFHAAEENLRRQMEAANRAGHAALEAARQQEEAQKRAAAATHRLTHELEEQAKVERRNEEELGKRAKAEIEAIDRVTKEQERQLLSGKQLAHQRATDEYRAASAAIQSANVQAQAIARLTGDYKTMAEAAWAAYTGAQVAAANYQKQLEQISQAERKASAESVQAYTAEVGAFAEGMANIIGSKKAYYAIKAAEEVAAGVEALAEGTWPPNPAALLASGIHFEAAADWAKIAGTSAGRRGSGASAGGGRYDTSGGGDYGRADQYGEGRLGAGDQGVAASRLSPGAQGSNGGRLNVIIIGESEQARFFADRVNEADKAGHFMAVTAARRSAPAQG